MITEPTVAPSPSAHPEPRRGGKSRVGPGALREDASALRWRLIQDGPGSGAGNMALDHALALGRAEGEAVLRLYRWSRPTVSFGRNEPAAGLYSRRIAQDRGIDCVRRPTGGRAVLHRDELTYCVVVPVSFLGGPRSTYRHINGALARSLASLGAPVSVSPEVPTPAIDSGPCFGSPAGGELVTGGRKLVGSAQARIGRSLLQHGSILLSGDQAELDGLLEVDTHRPGASATLAEITTGVDEKALRSALAELVPAVLGGGWASGQVRDGERAMAERLENDRYADEGWTWRR